jgi:sulfate transport system permease protein
VSAALQRRGGRFFTLLGPAPVLPGLRLSLGLAGAWLFLLVLLPLGALAGRAATLDWARALQLLVQPRTRAALGLSLGASLGAGLLALLLGALVAWVLGRYRFPGHGLLDALVDLPLALPTAVAGLTLTALFAPRGPLGRLLPAGVQIPFTRAGVVLALLFVGLPLVVRTVQPVAAGLEPLLEEAAATLGASRAQVLLRVVLPQLWPALLTGLGLAVARGLGEYGSVVFLSGNLPFRTEIAPLLIVERLEQYDDAGACALALLLLVASLALQLLVGRLQRRGQEVR